MATRPKTSDPVSPAAAAEPVEPVEQPAPAKAPAAPAVEFPFEHMDKWANSPFAWGAALDAVEAYKLWREQHAPKH